MDTLQIERSDRTPKIFFDPEELLFIIRGQSRPENARKFYEPVIKYLESFIAQRTATSAPLSVEVKLTYFNSQSMIYISEIFKLIKRIHNDGMRIIIDWYTDENDELLRDVGQELSELTDLPFNFIEE